MTARDEESKRVMAAAMRYVKDGNRLELETFPLQILQKADYQLSGRDEGSGYRNAIKDRITELQSSTNTHIDVIEVRPNFYGIGINFNEIGRRICRWLSKKG